MGLSYLHDLGRAIGFHSCFSQIFKEWSANGSDEVEVHAIIKMRVTVSTQSKNGRRRRNYEVDSRSIRNRFTLRINKSRKRTHNMLYSCSMYCTNI